MHKALKHAFEACTNNFKRRVFGRLFGAEHSAGLRWSPHRREWVVPVTWCPVPCGAARPMTAHVARLCSALLIRRLHAKRSRPPLCGSSRRHTKKNLRWQPVRRQPRRSGLVQRCARDSQTESCFLYFECPLSFSKIENEWQLRLSVDGRKGPVEGRHEGLVMGNELGNP